VAFLTAISMHYGDNKGVHKRTLHLQNDTESKFVILTTFLTSVNTYSFKFCVCWPRSNLLCTTAARLD